MEKEALVCYWSRTGNTEQVAETIKEALEENDLNVTYKEVEEMEDDDFLDYDWVFLGTPSHHFLPPKPVLKTLQNKLSAYSNEGEVKLCAPNRPGKKAAVFCTYSGPHTGIDEAIPVGKYLGQFLEHIGFNVVDEWYVIGEMHMNIPNINTEGKLGNIKGRPNEEDLTRIKNNVEDILEN